MQKRITLMNRKDWLILAFLSLLIFIVTVFLLITDTKIGFIVLILSTPLFVHVIGTGLKLLKDKNAYTYSLKEARQMIKEC